MNITKIVQEHVKEESEKGTNIFQGCFTEHFQPVVRYAKKL